MRTQPNLQAAGIGLESSIAFRQKRPAIEFPVVFAVKDPRRAHLPVKPIEGSHVAPLFGRLQPLDKRKQIFGFRIVRRWFVFVDPSLGKIGQRMGRV